MTNELTPPQNPPGDGPDQRRRRVSPLLAGALGAASLALAVVGFGVVGAGADDTPALADSLIEVDEPTGGPAVPEYVAELDAAFEAFDACLDEQLGELDFEVDEAVFDEAVFDEAVFDEVFEAAEEACEDLLPDEVRAEMAAFEPFEACLDEAEAGLGAVDAGIVWLDAVDGGQAIQFGDNPGTVTISGDATGVEIASSSGVTVLDEAALDDMFEAHDAAFEACEELLPEDALMGHFELGDEPWEEIED